MRLRRFLAWLSVAAAVACLLIGGAALKWYLWDILIVESGSPDRSMLFWGLPVVFIGLAAVGGGVGLGVLARSLFSARR
jgi:hypothetical protein